ncbi:MAG TPA: transglycosylase domain-containing protein, partial [Microthrixaceae bacterium]|nr:transglycosylase domain-containing protein [Microthrixaceae bacterium]
MRIHRPIVAPVIALTAVALLAVGCSTAREAPPLLLPVNAEPSAIYDANGTLITTLREENRSTVSLEQIPRVVQDAVVAIEDMRFWEHNGIDPRSIVRAAGSNAASGEVTQGGSTITQQYVKNALLTSEQTLSRKLEEASLAMALERSYSKELILELYLNTIYLGSGAYGVDAASESYFGVPVKSVDLAQAALLAGIIQSPSRLDPRNHPDAAIKRRNLVLKAMLDQGLVTKASYEQAVASGISLAEVRPLPEQQPYAAPHFVDEVKDWLINKSDALGKTPEERRENLLRGGLQISTTVDLSLQSKAEESIRAILPGQGVDKKIPDAALVSMDPKTGFVRAMVGGYDYFGTHAYRQLNLADGGGRQTGSAFKPI